jgi:hypothetical protein
MKLSSLILTELALEVAVGAQVDESIDRYVYALMATHVSEMLEASNDDKEAIVTLAASLVFLLVENFQLQSQRLV